MKNDKNNQTQSRAARNSANIKFKHSLVASAVLLGLPLSGQTLANETDEKEQDPDIEVIEVKGVRGN